jgi:hypothetical protein
MAGRYLSDIVSGGSLTGKNVGRKNPWISAGVEEEQPTQFGIPTGEDWASHNQRRKRLSEADFQSPVMQRYLEHISQTPNRADYNPSIWHRIVAGVAGGAEGGSRGALAGIKAAEEVKNLPYRRALEDYDIKGQGLESAAKLEQVNQKQKLEYHKYLGEEDEADRDRMVKWATQETARYNAETTRMRYEWDKKIREATNQRELDRLTAQKAQWEAANKEAAKRTGILQQQANTAANRATSYKDYLGTLGNKPPSQTQLAAARQLAEDEVRNEHLVDVETFIPTDPKTGKKITHDAQGRPINYGGPEKSWFGPDQRVLPQYAEDYEKAVRKRMKKNLGNATGFGDINLDDFDEDEENPYEELPQ